MATNLVNVVTFAEQPEKEVENSSNWGAVKVSSPDNSFNPEIIFAEMKHAYDAYSTQIILGVESYVNELGEQILALPHGDWDLTFLDAKGNTQIEKETPIVAGEFCELEYINNINNTDSTEYSKPTNEISERILDFHKYNTLNFSFNLGYADVEGGGFATCNGNANTNAGYNGENTPLKWTNNKFEFDVSESWVNLGGHDQDKLYKGTGIIFEDESGNLFANVSVTASRTAFVAEGGYMISEENWSITIENLPYGGQGYYGDIFIINNQTNKNLLNNLYDHVSEIEYYNKWTSTGGAGYGVMKVDNVNDLELNESAYIMIEFSVIE